MTGSGRLASLDRIVETTLAAARRRHDLSGETVVVTAGGTREPIDPVRFLGNRSSGRMGHALAEAASARGARVVLITASTLAAPAGCEIVRVETAEQMRNALREHFKAATVLIKAAAVADFRPATYSQAKLRRNGSLSLSLEATPDLVAEAVAARRPGTLVIAFAAETDNLEDNARAKLLRKGADGIVVNNVAQPGIGFESERNAGLFLTATRTKPLPETSKRAMADSILDEVRLLRHATPETTAPTPMLSRRVASVS